MPTTSSKLKHDVGSGANIAQVRRLAKAFATPRDSLKQGCLQLPKSTDPLERLLLLTTFFTLCVSQLYGEQETAFSFILTITMLVANVVVVVIVVAAIWHDTKLTCRTCGRRCQALCLCGCCPCRSAARLRRTTVARTRIVLNPLERFDDGERVRGRHGTL